VGLRQLAALTQLTSLRLCIFDCDQLDILAGNKLRVNLPNYKHSIINKVCCDAALTLAVACVWL